MKRMSLKARQRSRRNLERAIFKKELFHTPRRIRPKDTWSIKVDTAKFLVPRLKMFLKEIEKVGATPRLLALQYPDDGYERWREMVNKMLFSFEYYADYDERIMVASDSELRRVEERLFRPSGCSCRAVGLDLQSRPIEYKDFQSAKAMYCTELSNCQIYFTYNFPT